MTEKQYYSEQRVSSTSLKWFEHSPWYFRNMLDKEIEQVFMIWLEQGQQVHMAVLEPDLFERSYIYLEYTVPKSQNQKDFCEEYVKLAKKGFATPVDDLTAKIQSYSKAYNTKSKSDEKIEEESEKLYKSLKSYIDYLLSRKFYKDVLTKSRWKLIQDLKFEISEHKLASKLLAGVDPFDNMEEYNEIPIFWEYEVDGFKVPCKSMLDRIVIDHKNKVVKLIDLKTTSHIGDFKDSINTFKYNRQFAFYWQAIMSHFKGIEDYKKETYVIALQTKELPECKVFKISDNLLEDGNKEIESIMFDIAWHYNNNKWKYSREYYEYSGIDKTY